MNHLLPIPFRLIKPFYLVVVFILLAHTISAQKKSSTTVHEAAQTSKRVIYGTASFYANKFVGRQTASGELFSQEKFTCACNMVPLGTWVKVTNVRNGKSVIVKVNDRIHPRMRRVVDLSKIAARRLGYTAKGLVRVKVEVIGKKKPV
jgi:rare lipoprotein A